MMNLTLALDTNILKVARKVAIEQDTTVTAMVRGFLTHLAETYHQGESDPAKKLEACFQRNSMNMGKRTWEREDLYDRY